MRESEVELHFQWAVEMAGGKTYKTKCIGRVGFPDRLAKLPDGSLWLVELKTRGGRLSAAQKQFAADMAGSNYAVLWDKQQVDAWLKEALDGF